MDCIVNRTSEHTDGPPLPPPAQAPERSSASDLVRTALRKDSHLDFRQITEICERLETEPHEMSETISVLTTALQDEDTPLRAKLQALTILNEATYNAKVVAACREAVGLQSVLASLRDVNNKEPGDLTAENVRMLANELDRVCFVGPVTGKPSSPNRAANAHLERLEKARQKAQEMLEISQQKAARTLEKTATSMSSAIRKAERTLDRTADLVMQEAERTLSNMVIDGHSIEAPDHNQVQQQRQQQQQYKQPLQPQLQKQEQQEHVAWEQRQLQWALQSSFAENSRSQTTSRAAAPCTSRSAAPGPVVLEENQGHQSCMTDFYHSVGTVTESIRQAEDRAATAEKCMADQLAREQATATGDVDLMRRVEESSNIATELTARLARANAELGLVVEKEAKLETALRDVQAGLTVHNTAALVPRLRAQIAKQESLLATQTAAQRQGGHAATEAVAATVPGHASAVGTAV